MADQISEPIGNSVVVYALIDYTPTQREIAFAVYCNTKREFQIGRFNDNQHYSYFQSFLIQMNPKEQQSAFSIRCIAPQLKHQKKKILEKLIDYNAQLDQSTTFIGGNIENALSYLMNKQLKLFRRQLEDKKCMNVLERLLNLLKLQKQQKNKGQFNLTMFNLKASMILDKPSINALQIFAKQNDKKILSTNSTVFDVVNKCKTNFGARCLRRWMKQPLQDKKMIEERLQQVEYFVENSQIKSIFQNELKSLPDLDRLYFVFYSEASGAKRKCEVSDLVKIYKVIISMRELLNLLEDKKDSHPILAAIYINIQKNTDVFEKVGTMIQKTIDMTARKESDFIVKPRAMPKLDAIMQQIKDSEREIENEIKRVSKHLDLEVQKNFSTTYRYVLEANKKNAINAVKESAGYRFLTAKQTKITFVTDNLNRWCEKLRVLEEEYKTEQEQIVKQMFCIVAGYYPVMEELSRVLGEVDVLTAFANVVSCSAESWCRPVFSDSLVGVGMRHPCIRNCVPNDCRLHDKARTMVLTGPNMGGKSTYIRTIGICVYLAHIGCYVPAKSFQTPLVDAIITRVGASDLQVKGISTFMSEMLESSCMLQTATCKSLVLIDELGRGTSTCEGFGIAWGICQHLHQQIRPFTLFATHFQEMTRMTQTLTGVVNAHTLCRFQQHTFQLLFTVVEGVANKSYGIQVLKMLAFPPSIVASSSKYLRYYEDTNCIDTTLYSESLQRQIVDLYDQMTHQQALSPSLSLQIHQKYRPIITRLLTH